MAISHLTERNHAIFSELDGRICSNIQKHPLNLTDAKMSYVVQIQLQARHAQNVAV